MPLLFLLFIIIPSLEIAVFIEIGGVLGVPGTLLCVLLTAAAGSFLLRQQGMRILLDVHATMERGEVPLKEMFHGACVVLAGIVLLTPGFLTDVAGLLLMIPGVRDFLRRRFVTDLSIVDIPPENSRNKNTETIIDVDVDDHE